jgi:hypothetical protein
MSIRFVGHVVKWRAEGEGMTSVGKFDEKALRAQHAAEHAPSA